MMRGAIFVHSLFKTLRFPVAGLALVFFLGGRPQPAMADEPAWLKSLIQHVLKMRVFRDFGIGKQSPPAIIPRSSVNADPSGLIASYQPDGPTVTKFNAFFQDLGTNQRTCFTCHQPQTGWSVSAASVQARFDATSPAGTEPIFRLFDGATCPNKDVSTVEARRDAFKLLRLKGLIRIPLPLPAGAEFTLTSVSDPYNCTTDPIIGTDPVSGGPMLSTYRRPLPATNLTFVPGLPSSTIPSAIMWDGREPSLEHQAVSATLGHAQAIPPPLPQQIPNISQQGQIVAFQKGIFTAQAFDTAAGVLDGFFAANATGGPVELSKQTIGTPTPPTPDFNLYLPWLNQPGARLSIARGEELFNGTVASGLTGKKASCAGCHNDANVGNHATKPFFPSLGIAGDPANPPLGLAALDVTGLPVFTFTCTATGQTITVTDPGLALMTGKCADIGKFKTPLLRGLASRAPYFHNGSAATLADVVNFYDAHFDFGFSPQDKADLVNFMNAL